MKAKYGSVGSYFDEFATFTQNIVFLCLKLKIYISEIKKEKKEACYLNIPQKSYPRPHPISEEKK